MTEEQNRNKPLPIPPKGYIFDQPDSPETILFEQFNRKPAAAATSKSEEIANEIPESSFDGMSIKAATLEKLVERLTHHLYLHPKFSSTFLMFFREFCTPKQLLSLLSIRYHVPDLDLDQLNQIGYFNRLIIYYHFMC